jgi:hypothetical protein
MLHWGLLLLFLNATQKTKSVVYAYLSNNFITWQSAEVLKYDKILIKKSHDSFLYREVHPTYHPCGMLTAVYSKGNICEGTDLERLHTICYKSFILRQNQKNLLGLIPICLNP